MNRGILIFLATFVVGALVALAARAALHDPHVAATATLPSSEYAPMVGNALTPAASPPPANAAGAGADHAGHSTMPVEGSESSVRATPTAAEAAEPVARASKTVNTRCAICGMEVDPSLPTMEYQGKQVGFGCRMCAPKFKADPDKYGPIYLGNEVIKR